MSLIGLTGLSAYKIIGETSFFKLTAPIVFSTTMYPLLILSWLTKYVIYAGIVFNIIFFKRLNNKLRILSIFFILVYLMELWIIHIFSA